MVDEQWQDVPGYRDYQASTEGQIRNRRSGRVLTGTITKNGYRQVNVNRGGYRVCAFAHRLVALAFFGPAPPGYVTNHLNANKLDNRPSNLEWTTPEGNSQHAVALGLFKPVRLFGEKNPNAKLTADRVRELRALRQQGTSFAELGRVFGVSTRYAYLVANRTYWKHVT
ncbi:NUMOD4 motif protein [Gemmata sp. SH-PL17]|uniref:HNH endonuclease n=1 Tax=Gemmata sp. SH-PL17 TaxID=1630693 RepID=UPI00078E4292|nr:HNH endonuclease [Gemmata sp. SH-PL17]AMV29393.1 NUMOD4 motif protein [Gemmata sp. SH-PL17]